MTEHTQAAAIVDAVTRTSRWRRIFSTDHRTIARQYFALALAAVLAGVVLSLLMRIHIVWPDARIPLIGTVAPETYLAWMTIHGSLMVFFVLTTAPIGAFGNLVLPDQIGAFASHERRAFAAEQKPKYGARSRRSSEMAFPVLNALSFWVTLAALLILLASFFVAGGAQIAGWTAYPPLSAFASAGPGLAAGMDCWLASIALFCIAQIFQSINFIATPLRCRARGMSLMRMPLTVWGWFVSGQLALPIFSALFAAVVLLFCDRHLGTSFFIPSGEVVNGVVSTHRGGSPLLWQHLFWFFGHPEVYLAILPGMGIVSTLLSNFARRPVFAYRGMVYATYAIAILGMLVWGHHMFVSGMSPFAGSVFAVMTMIIAVPSSLKVLSWTATVWRGSSAGTLRFSTPMLFSIGFVSLFIAGGITGPILAQPLLDTYVHDTYFVVAHFHLIMAMAGMFSIFAATYYWAPLLFAFRGFARGPMLSERLGHWHFWLTLFGAYAVFIPMHLLGLAGHPRRYSQLAGSAPYIADLLPLQRFITVAALVLAGSQLVFLWNLIATLKQALSPADATKVDANPWKATTLEWLSASEKRAADFSVVRGACDYGPYDNRDFRMQHDPMPPETTLER